MAEQVLGLAVVRAEGGLKMHARPDQGSTVVDSLEPGTVVRVFERRPNGWWLIGNQRKGEKEECGWCVGRYLRWQPAPQRPPAPPKPKADSLDDLDRIGPWPWICAAVIIAAVLVWLFVR